MKIINGTKIYQKDLKKLEKIDNGGWDTYNGQNHQWYTLNAVQTEHGIVYNLSASNSGSCYGDYSDKYFLGGKRLMQYVANKYYMDDPKEKIGELLGDIDETNNLLKAVVEDIF